MTYDYAKYAADWRAKNPDKDKAARQSFEQRHPESRLLANARHRAAERGWECNLTGPWIAERIAKGFCEVTGLPFDVSRGSPKSQNPFRPSIDRKDISLGYTQSNCQVVIWAYNSAKATWDHDIVMLMAKALVERSKL